MRPYFPFHSSSPTQPYSIKQHKTPETAKAVQPQSESAKTPCSRTHSAHATRLFSQYLNLAGVNNSDVIISFVLRGEGSSQTVFMRPRGPLSNQLCLTQGYEGECCWGPAVSGITSGTQGSQSHSWQCSGDQCQEHMPSQVRCLHVAPL